MSRLAGWLKNGDDLVLHFMNMKMRCLFLDKWMVRITRMGGAIFTISLMLVMLLTSIHLGMEGLVSLAASHVLVQLMKRGFSRSRPYLSNGNVMVVGHPLKDYSFPSGHSTAIFSVVTTLSLCYPWLSIILMPAACAVALSRIYLGHHYPTDVSIGAMLGFFSAILVHQIFL